MKLLTSLKSTSAFLIFAQMLWTPAAFAQNLNSISEQLHSYNLLNPELFKKKDQSDQKSSSEPTSEPTEECQSFITGIQDKYTYGWIEAPLNYSLQNSEKIKVFYYYKKTEKLKNPILFFNGGPGFSSHSSVSQIESSIAKLEVKGQLDFIYIDQRGTGCSSPSFPIGASTEIFENLKWSASLGIVNDSEILREQLLGPGSKWKIFGQSYGAYIVYRYIEKYPASISKAYAHGNAIGMTDYDGSYFRILSQHTVTEKYLKLFTDDRKRLQALNQYFSDPTKCLQNTLNQSMCGYENMSPFVYLLGFRDSWKYLHIYLQRIVPESTVDEVALKNYVSQNVSQSFYYRESEAPEKWAERVTFFYNFAGLYDWDNTPLDAAKCNQIYVHLKEQHKLTPELLLLNECKAPMQFNYQDQMAAFIKSKIDLTKTQFVDLASVDKNLLKFKIPLYSYSGETDCFIPKQYFNKQNKLFGKKVTYKNFETSGHEGFYTERQIYADLLK